MALLLSISYNEQRYMVGGRYDGREYEKAVYDLKLTVHSDHRNNERITESKYPLSEPHVPNRELR